MKKPEFLNKIKIEAVFGLVLLISLVAGGLYMFSGAGNSSEPTVALPAPAPGPAAPAENGSVEPASDVAQDTDFENYYGQEPAAYTAVPVSAATETDHDDVDYVAPSDIEYIDWDDLDDLIDDSDDTTDENNNQNNDNTNDNNNTEDSEETVDPGDIDMGDDDGNFEEETPEDVPSEEELEDWING